jgi:twitching motility protein PilT
VTGVQTCALPISPDTTATIQRYVGLFDANEQEVARDRLADCLQAVISLRLLAAKDGSRRVPAVEILRVTRSMRECIRNSARLGDVPELIRKGRDLYSMQLFDQHLVELVSSGVISLDTAKHAATNPEELERTLRMA